MGLAGLTQSAQNLPSGRPAAAGSAGAAGFATAAAVVVVVVLVVGGVGGVVRGVGAGAGAGADVVACPYERCIERQALLHVS